VTVVLARALFHKSIMAAKRLWYFGRGEPLTYGSLTLRYVPGSRPVREKYATSTDVVARNDALQMRFFARHLRPGDFAIDVGGHYGQYAVLFGTLVGASGRVVTFEPDVAAHSVLLRNLELNGLRDRVLVERSAVFDTTGTQEFFSTNGNSQSSMARSALGDRGAAANRHVVPTVRLDDFLETRRLGPPNIVKLDVEGAEIGALRGAPAVLRSAAIIVCELHPYAWPELNCSFDDLLRLTRDAGRRIRYLDPASDIADGPVYGAVVIE
jgi:FkbM family methyltransferase